MKKRRVIYVLAVLIFALLSACGKEAPPPGEQITSPPEPSPVSEAPAPTMAPAPTATPEPTPTPEPTATPEPTPAPWVVLPQMDSSTARIPITTAIYEHFTEYYEMTGPEPLASKTHGAWLNLADGAADIIFLVAPTADELDYFAQKGVDIEMKVFGFDGLVFMGNDANPAQNLSAGQIRDIYSGKITNWKDVGGEDADIFVYIRDPESGSQRLFESLVWDGYDMPDFSSMGFTEGEMFEEIGFMEAITLNVLANENSIGFNIMSYISWAFDDSSLKLFSVDGYEPTTENFESGAYPFLTTSYVAIRADEPEDSPAKRLYDWIGYDNYSSYQIIQHNSTLTISFSDSVCIRTGNGDPAALAETIESLDKRLIERRELLRFTPEEIGDLRFRILVRSNSNYYQDKNLETLLAYEKELERALANRK